MSKLGEYYIDTCHSGLNIVQVVNIDKDLVCIKVIRPNPKSCFDVGAIFHFSFCGFGNRFVRICVVKVWK